MDINSLLSPADSPATETPSPSLPASATSSPARPHPRPSVQQRKSSGLSQHYSPSPRASEQSLPAYAAHNAAYQNQQASFAAAYGSTASAHAPAHPTSDPRQQQQQPLQPPMQRHGSTPQMDTLADLASMQNHRQHSSPRPSLPSREATASRSYTLHNLPRPPLSARSSNEIVMTDPATQELRTYRSVSLSDDDCALLDGLGNHLVTNPFDYTSHVQFITVLQTGFAAHSHKSSNPKDYELLEELRNARKQMDQVFPLGEALWLSSLDDEMALAATVDDRLKLMDLFARAVTDEPSSARLWRKYGDYTYTLWATVYKVGDAAAAAASWSEQDLQLGQQYFKWEPMLRIWEQGVAHTHYRLNDSHLVWDQYIGVLIQDHEKWPLPAKVNNIKQKFAERLAEAHATWENTYQIFGQFLSAHDANNYEETMMSMSRSTGAKTAWRIRERYEVAIQQATESGNETAEYEAYVEYLTWEIQKAGVFSFRMINSLYERATIRFPSVQSFWIDYIDYLLGKQSTPEIPVMPIIERATRHCPWSGDLWAHRLLTMEIEGRPFADMEHVKHRATSTGLLDVGGMEELMKVYVAWCGGLRRRAYAVGASEDELDIAEVAIRSALEHVRKIGHDKYADKYTGDPHYRLERIYIKFMMQKGEIDIARNSWQEILQDQSNSYDFWYRFYMWEMVVWAKFAMRAGTEPETQLRPPEHATGVLKQALEHVDTMDCPEQLVTMFLNHCEHHESVLELRQAVIKAREVNRQIAKRRERESLAAQQAQGQVEEVPAAAAVNGKRKRESNEEGQDDGNAKKTRSNEPEVQVQQESSAASAHQPKRDREHTTIIVSNLPTKATEGSVKHFFRDCGTIKSVKLAKEEKTDSQTATLEFEVQEEASYATMKHGKRFQDQEIQVRFGTGCTVFITNYPPEADKSFLRDLFKDCGEIAEIRMPSLKLNTNRRFAYIQFLDPDAALKATTFDGKILDKEGKYKILVAISDPSKAGDRHGAQADGREIFVGNVYWYAREEEVKTLFESAGTVESVRIPRNLQGKSKGSAFVVFETKEGAEKAVSTFDGHEFKDRRLHVEISKPVGSRTKTSLHREGRSATPGEAANADASAAAAPVVVNGDTSASAATTEPAGRDHKDRTIALLDIPDTVTAARLEKLVQQYGTIRKFTLRPDHAGAIVEFADVSSVGKAQLGLDGFRIEESKIRVGTVGELMKQNPLDTTKIEKTKPTAKNPKANKAVDGGVAAAGKKKLTPFGQPLARPAQRGGLASTRGRRGGLGFSSKRGGGDPADGEKTDGAPKSNDYFRELMAKNSVSSSAAPTGKENDGKDREDRSSDRGEVGKGDVEEREEEGDLLDDIMGGDEEDGGGGVVNGAVVDGDGDGDGDDGLLDDLMD